MRSEARLLRGLPPPYPPPSGGRAREGAQRVLELRSRPVQTILLLAAALLGACGGSQAAANGEKLEEPELPPVKPEALAQFDAGMRALRLGGPEAAEKAVPRLLEATAIDDTLWEAHHNVGVVRFRRGDSEGAIRAFSQALEINPAHIPTVMARAEAYRRHGEEQAAREDYETVLEQVPNDMEAHARLASLLRDVGDYEDALNVLREALRRAGPSAEIYTELGLVYLAQGRDELAELVLSKAAEQNSEDPAIHNALALVALDRGEDQLAFERFNHATSLDPDYNDARYNKASVLIDAGDYQAARTELREVVKRDPGDLHARVALGVAERGLANYDRCRELWEKVAREAPRQSRVRGNALYNLFILELDFEMDNEKAKAALDRFLQYAPAQHPKREEAEQRKKELGL